MAIHQYRYDDKIWTAQSTYADGNCFFHAVFGQKGNLDGNYLYFDRQATFRRFCWAAFLMFYINEEMPEILLEAIKNCLIINDMPSTDDYLQEYIEKVAQACHWVWVAEIPILCTLWNVKVVLFLEEKEHPDIFEPNPQLLGNFPFGSTAQRAEKVIRLRHNHFEKLTNSIFKTDILEIGNSQTEPGLLDSDTDEEIRRQESLYLKKQKNNHPKRGNAGISGGLYQVDLLTMVLLNAVKKSKVWLLSTENAEFGKFDDLIFDSPSGYVILQAKHKDKGKKVINHDAIFSIASNADFGLPTYFDSFVQKRKTYNIQNIVICTNAKLQTDKKMKGYLKEHTASEDSVLQFAGGGTIDPFMIGKKFYTFDENNDKLVMELKTQIEKHEPKYKENTNLDDEIKTFLAHLQVFVSYMDENTIDKVIDGLISSISLAEGLNSRDTFKYIKDLIMEWFQGRDGIHISHLHAKAMFFDIRSNKYCETFQLYDISFKSSNFKHLAGRILHIIPSQEPALNAVKFYQALQEEQNVKALFLNPNDNISIQLQGIHVFSISRYTYLVIISPIKANEHTVNRLCKKVTNVLDSSEYKKLVLIADAEDKMVQQIKSSNGYERVSEAVSFKNLTEESQDNLKKRRNIIFQGHDMTLEELVVQDIDDFIDTETLAKLAKNDRIEIGAKVKLKDEDISNYYISRNLRFNGKTIPEKEFRHLNDLQEKIVLISDSAGMGKTTILRNLAIGIKEDYPSLWVITIDLNNHSSTFKAALKKRLKSISVVDILNNQEATRLDGEFSRNLFHKEDNVILMLDAVDEISSGYLNLVMNMVHEATTHKNFAKIFITTRPHLCEDLKEQLKVNEFTLQPFSKDNQEDFLTMYWTQKLGLKIEEDKQRCRQYARALIYEMSRWIDEESENTFAGIPLQTRMLAEVFQEKNQLDQDETSQWEECKEFLSSDRDEPQLPKKINLIQLYQLFIAKKRDIFVDIKGNTGGNPITENALMQKFEECHEYHRALALPIIFYSNECRLFRCFKIRERFSDSFVEDYVLRAGILQRLEGKINFIHRTFAEYFAAECLVLKLRQGSISKAFQAFLLDEVLIRDEFTVVRAFFDSFMQNELASIPEDTLESFCEMDYISVLSNINTSYLHLLAQDGLLGILEFFFACVNFGITGDREIEEEDAIFVSNIDKYCNTPLHETCSRGHLNVAMVLIQRGANVNFKNANGETPLHMAALEGHFEIVEYLVDKTDVELKEVNTIGETALHYAVRGNHLNIVKFLIGHGVDYQGTYTTALHMACREHHFDIVKYLVEEVIPDINILDYNECTPLHAATDEGHLDVIEYLVQQGSDVNAVNNEGNTAFHDAALRRFLHIVKFFAENNADRTIEGSDGYNIMELLEWLMEKENQESEENSSADDANEEENESGSSEEEKESESSEEENKSESSEENKSESSEENKSESSEENKSESSEENKSESSEDNVESENEMVIEESDKDGEKDKNTDLMKNTETVVYNASDCDEKNRNSVEDKDKTLRDLGCA